MTKDDKPYETKLTVALDRRAKFSEADRKAQYDAAMKVKALFGDESALMDRILTLRAGLAKSEQALASDEADSRSAISRENRRGAEADRRHDRRRRDHRRRTLREHTDQLYGVSYEGNRPTIGADRLVSGANWRTPQKVRSLLTNELPKLNRSLKAKGQPADRTILRPKWR